MSGRMKTLVLVLALAVVALVVVVTTCDRGRDHVPVVVTEGAPGFDVF